MRTSDEVNVGIERINSLLSEISSIGWDICHYFDDKYGVEDYQYDEKVTDKTELEIVQHAQNCGMIETWNEFGFGQLVMPDDNKQKEAIEWLEEFLQGIETEDKMYFINLWVDYTSPYGMDDDEIKPVEIDGIFWDEKQNDIRVTEDRSSDDYCFYDLTPESQMDIIETIKKEMEHDNG